MNSYYFNAYKLINVCLLLINQNLYYKTKMLISDNLNTLSSKPQKYGKQT